MTDLNTNTGQATDKAPGAMPDSNTAVETPEIGQLLEGLNDEQLAAVTHDGGPLLIVAGAGTGKTTVVSKRIAWLIATGRAKPEEILALTFTEKAAGEMIERVDQLLPLGYTDLWISTFHAFCRRILEERGLDIGVPNEFRLFDQTDSYLLARQHLDDFSLDYYRPLGNPTKFLHSMLKHFSRAKDEDVSPEDYAKYAAALPEGDGDSERAAETVRERELARAYATYQQLLLDEGALDLGDLHMYSIRLFRSRPQVLAEFRKRFKYVLVDEFQDTNWAQYELIKMIAGVTGNLVVVGDDDQSIYKFRGASVANIMQFKGDFPSAKEVVLTRNYRSLQSILDLSYAFIQKNNPNRLEAKLTTSDGRPLVKRLVGEREGVGAIRHLRFATHDEEVAGVIDRICELREASPDRTWSDFAILVRSNSSADDYSRMLQRRGIPFQFLANRGLYAKPVILDCLAYFALLDDYHESTALYRVLSSPAYAIPGADLVMLAHEARRSNDSIYQVIKRGAAVAVLSPEAHPVLDRLLADIERHTRLATSKSVAQVLIAFLTDSGYLKLLKSAADARAREQFGYLHQFLDRLKKFEETHEEPTLKRFLEEHEIERESGEEGALSFDPDTGPDMVRIMTAHSSKGLEFPYVFITDLVDKRFPTIARKDGIELPAKLVKETLPETGDAHLEEERRLMYVAMTRAKDGLYLTSAEDYGGKTKKKPSLFLAELGLDAVPGLAPNGERLAEPAPAPVIEEAQLAIPTHFSFSQLAAYSNCPLQYKFAHVIKVPSLGKGTQSFGKTMHAALEWFVGEVSKPDGLPKGQLPVTLEQLLAKYEECWLDDWYESREEKEKFRENGRAALRRFYDRCLSERPRALWLEQSFSLKFGEFVIKGAIDRVDEVDGGVAIIDYKTGKPKLEEDLKLEDKKQLLLYQIAVERLFGKKPQRLTFEYLQDGSSVNFLGTEKQLAKVEAEAEETIAAITARDFGPTPGRHCKNCDFREICEFRAA